MNTRIRKIGNSEGVILPKDALEQFGLASGDELMVVKEANGLRLVPVNDAGEHKRRMEIARDRMKKYSVALRELAK